MDDRAAARQATKHLLGLGHTRIGMIAGDYKFSSSILRVETFQATMEAAGHARAGRADLQGRLHVRGRGGGGRGLLDLPEPPTAIMASNDQMALGVVSVAQARGLAVPGDLSILSYDDTIGVRLSVPSLTAVRQPVAKMAEKAADMLINASAAGEKQIAGSTLVPFELMVRASTGRRRSSEAQREDPGPELSASGGPGSAALRALSGMTAIEFEAGHAMPSPPRSPYLPSYDTGSVLAARVTSALAQVARRGAQRHLVGAGGDRPGLGLGVEGRQQARVDRDADLGAGARGQVDLLEAAQAARRFPARTAFGPT
jgi:hypothetical protein